MKGEIYDKFNQNLLNSQKNEVSKFKKKKKKKRIIVKEAKNDKEFQSEEFKMPLFHNPDRLNLTKINFNDMSCQWSFDSVAERRIREIEQIDDEKVNDRFCTMDCQELPDACTIQ